MLGFLHMLLLNKFLAPILALILNFGNRLDGTKSAIKGARASSTGGDGTRSVQGGDRHSDGAACRHAGDYLLL